MDQAPPLTYNDLLLENQRLKNELDRKNIELIQSRQLENNRSNALTSESSSDIRTPLGTNSGGEMIVVATADYSSLVHQKDVLIQVVLRLKEERDELKKACKVLATSRNTMIKVIDDLSTKVKLLHRALQETHSHAAVASKSPMRDSFSLDEEGRPLDPFSTLMNSLTKLYKTFLFYNYHQSSISPVFELLTLSYTHAEHSVGTLSEYVNENISRIFPREHAVLIPESIARTEKSQNAEREKNTKTAKSKRKIVASKSSATRSREILNSDGTFTIGTETPRSRGHSRGNSREVGESANYAVGSDSHKVEGVSTSRAFPSQAMMRPKEDRDRPNSVQNTLPNKIKSTTSSSNSTANFMAATTSSKMKYKS